MSTFYRRPKTTAERRANGSRKDRDLAIWRRAKRSAKNLPNAYDDIKGRNSKSWKKTRRTQYKCPGRGQKHEYLLENPFDRKVYWQGYSRFLYYLAEYFIENQIGYKFEEICHIEQIIECCHVDQKGFRSGEMQYIVYYEGLTEDYDYYRHYRFANRLDGCKITWWSQKDIGFQYLLKKYYHNPNHHGPEIYV